MIGFVFCSMALLSVIVLISIRKPKEKRIKNK